MRNKSVDPLQTPVIARPFADAWPLAAAQEWIAVTHTERPEHNTPAYQDWFDNRRMPAHRRLCSAIAGHLLHLKGKGMLKEADAWGRRMHWAEVWNSVVASDVSDPSALNALAQDLVNRLDFKAIGVPAEVFHGQMSSMMEAGDFEWFGMGSGVLDKKCRNSGERLEIEFRKWQPVVGTVDHESLDARFVPLSTPQPAYGIVHLEIPVPTGELWVADWFRLPGNALTEALKTERNRFKTEADSINTLEGCRRSTQRHAQKGIAHFFVGNTCPTAVLDGGRLVVGRLKEGADAPVDGDAPGHQSGTVITDLWWATMADRQTLLDVLSPSLGKDGAAKTLDAYRAEHEDAMGLTVFKVSPGTYHLYVAAHGELFAEKFAADGVDLGGFETPMGVLSAWPLTLVEKQQAKRKRATP